MSNKVILPYALALLLVSTTFVSIAACPVGDPSVLYCDDFSSTSLANYTVINPTPGHYPFIISVTNGTLVFTNILNTGLAFARVLYPVPLDWRNTLFEADMRQDTPDTSLRSGPGMEWTTPNMSTLRFGFALQLDGQYAVFYLGVQGQFNDIRIPFSIQANQTYRLALKVEEVAGVNRPKVYAFTGYVNGTPVVSTTEEALGLNMSTSPTQIYAGFAAGAYAWAPINQIFDNAIITALRPPNTPPVANAGENLTITSQDYCRVVSIIQGTASDADHDALKYRWLEGQTEVLTWNSVGSNGEATLDLCAVSLSLGQHTLTLEVSDSKATARDDMLLTINNSAPTAGPNGGGRYQIGMPITVGGQVSDFDGDLLTYTWSEAGIPSYYSGSIQSTKGGTPVDLQPFQLPYLALGTHTVLLTVSDGTNTVSSSITIDVADTTAPTLTPIPNITILWPPDHKMVNIIINANAQDESGLPVTLSAAVTSNEPQEGLGDGDMAPDWTTPEINQQEGVITLQLRAERSGRGNGRKYLIAVTATDQAGNSSNANVEILVPHDQGKK